MQHLKSSLTSLKKEHSFVKDLVELEVGTLFSASLLIIRRTTSPSLFMPTHAFKYCLKDGAYFCYCAYVLCISTYSGFQWVVPTNTGIFLPGLKLCGESTTWQVLLVSKKKIRGNRAFFRDNKASIWKKMPLIALYFTVFLE